MSYRVKQSIGGILLIIMLAGFIYIGGKEYKHDAELTDAEKFSQEYPDIPSDNKFTYLSNNGLMDFLSNGTGILFLANPSSPYSEPYAKILNATVSESPISEIYYYNISRAKESNNKYYKALTAKVKDELVTTDTSTENLFTPMVVFIKDGQVLASDNTSAVVANKLTPEEFWTSERQEEFVNLIKTNIALLNEEEEV